MSDHNETTESPRAMEVRRHIERLRSGKFLMVGSGESYFTEVVSGDKLLDRMMAAQYGEDRSDWDEDYAELLNSWLNDPDQWHSDPDLGPTRYEQDVGETDHLSVFRMTHES